MTRVDGGNPYLANGLDGQLRDDLNAAFDSFWENIPPELYERRDEEDREERLQSEHAFVGKVLDATASLADSHDGPVTILFDLDETVVKKPICRDENAVFVRPGFGIVMNALNERYGDRVDFGILTTRGESHLQSELAQPETLPEIFAHSRINPDFVISSRAERPRSSIYDAAGMEDVVTYAHLGEESLALASIRKIVRPEIAAAVDEGRALDMYDLVPRGDWYDSKLAIVAHLADTNPDRGFVYVDDMGFPASIDNDQPRVRGVHLGYDAMFTI